jgi:hypothetical protein
MKSIKFIVILMTIAFTITNSYAKIKNPKTETYKVYGNCSMCKKTIEKAVKQNKDAIGIWDKKSKMLTFTYNTKKTNADEILKRVANAGYDNEKYLASIEAYNNLDDCCQYERKVTDKTPVESTVIPTAETPPAKTDDLPMKTETKDTAKIFTPPAETISKPAPEIKKTKTDFIPLLTQYFALKNALIADNSTLSGKNAALLLSEINAIKMENMSVSDHKVWMIYFDKLKSDANKISSTKNLEKQRTVFSSLSNNLWLVVKGLKLKDNGAIYVDYCPMYNNNKGAYWLSKESAIKNPYYGKSMLTCGSIKETIK